MVTVAGMSVGKTTLKMQFASMGRLSWKPTIKLEASFTIVLESALPNLGLKSSANSVA